MVSVVAGSFLGTGCQANQEYRAFAKKADQEGFSGIAKLFRLTAEAERIHAEGHLKSLDSVGSTTDNLQAAISAETYEFQSMYPQMVARAQAEEHKATRLFKLAVDVEKIHANLYEKALEAARRGKDLEADFYLCPECGFIEIGLSAAPCPICGTRSDKFLKGE